MPYLPHAGRCRHIQAFLSGDPCFCNHEVMFPGSDFCHWHQPKIEDLMSGAGEAWGFVESPEGDHGTV